MATSELVALFLYFVLLAYLAVGGAPTVLPEMHRYVVDLHGWMTSAQFAELYAIAQIAPGPNVMYLPLMGWKISGWAGAAATTVPFMMPSLTLTLFVARLHAKHRDATLGVALRRGLTPITIGLIFASGWILMPAVNRDWRGYVLTLLTVVMVLRVSKVNPLWLLAAGAVAGMVGVV